MFNLFKICFNCGRIPSAWQKAIILCPIPKSAAKDPHIPLNYRGISLLSCIAKAYSSLLNRRIVIFCELTYAFSDEQNGCRHDRSCVDHIFSLTAIIRNRMAVNMPTFCCFIDMQKAFDWVDRKMLLYGKFTLSLIGSSCQMSVAVFSLPVANR